MKTENPNLICKYRCDLCHPCPKGEWICQIIAKNWQQGYSAAMADNQPIAFKDRLPEEGQQIIVVNSVFAVSTLFNPNFLNAEKKYYRENHFGYIHVTGEHWMPFPQI